MPLIGRTITISSEIRPSSSKRRMSTPCRSLLANVCLEHQDRRVPVFDLLDVAEVLEDLHDGAEDHAQRLWALVRLEDDRALEGDVLGEEVGPRLRSPSTPRRA